MKKKIIFIGILLLIVSLVGFLVLKVLYKKAERNVATENDIRIRFQSVINMIRSMNYNNAIIISHNSVINTWKCNTMKNNWEIIEM
jgi:hypothetical protein